MIAKGINIVLEVTMRVAHRYGFPVVLLVLLSFQPVQAQESVTDQLETLRDSAAFLHQQLSEARDAFYQSSEECSACITDSNLHSYLDSVPRSLENMLNRLEQLHDRTDTLGRTLRRQPEIQSQVDSLERRAAVLRDVLAAIGPGGILVADGTIDGRPAKVVLAPLESEEFLGLGSFAVFLPPPVKPGSRADKSLDVIFTPVTFSGVPPRNLTLGYGGVNTTLPNLHLSTDSAYYIDRPGEPVSPDPVPTDFQSRIEWRLIPEANDDFGGVKDIELQFYASTSSDTAVYVNLPASVEVWKPELPWSEAIWVWLGGMLAPIIGLILKESSDDRAGETNYFWKRWLFAALCSGALVLVVAGILNFVSLHL